MILFKACMTALVFAFFGLLIALWLTPKNDDPPHPVVTLLGLSSVAVMILSFISAALIVIWSA